MASQEINSYLTIYVNFPCLLLDTLTFGLESWDIIRKDKL